MKRNTNTETNDTQAPTLFEINEIAGNVLNFSSTLSELRKTVDPQLVRHRAGRRDRNGNLQMVEYVEWHTVADILDEHAPNWGHAVKDIRAIGDIIAITVAITVDGVTREGLGTGKASSETGIKKAEHDALKRAAVKFGIARELYKREFDSINQEQTVPTTEPAQYIDGMSKTVGDMVTAKQLGMIRAIARETKIDVDRECSQMMHCAVNELSKRAASGIIAHLQNLPRNAALPMRLVG